MEIECVAEGEKVEEGLSLEGGYIPRPTDSIWRILSWSQGRRVPPEDHRQSARREEMDG